MRRVDAQGFLDDVRVVPQALDALADAITAEDPWGRVDPATVTRVLFLGMGSSRYAAEAVALALRADGVCAVAEAASVEATWPPRPGQLTVAVSAGGSSVETVAAAGRYAPDLTALVENTGSQLAALAGHVVPLLAGPESGGVACRSYRHTLVQLLALRARLTGRPVTEVADTARRAAEATADLLERQDDWLPRVLATLDGPDGVAVLAPAERRCSAEQSALMIREGPHRPATASETGDWAHVDVYLAKTLDYRVLLFPGSRWDAQAMEWLTRRGSRVIPVGEEVAGAGPAVPGPAGGWVRALTDPLVAELTAAAWWALRPPA
jgi:glutamine---fructose-6-phosphate transaminase (isomerizing)